MVGGVACPPPLSSFLKSLLHTIYIIAFIVKGIAGSQVFAGRRFWMLSALAPSAASAAALAAPTSSLADHNKPLPAQRPQPSLPLQHGAEYILTLM